MSTQTTFPSLAVGDLLRSVDAFQPVSDASPVANVFYGEQGDDSMVLVHNRDGEETIERGLGPDNDSYLSRSDEAEGIGPNMRSLPSFSVDLPEVIRRVREEIFPELAGKTTSEVYILSNGHWLPEVLGVENKAIWFVGLETDAAAAGVVIDASTGDVLISTEIQPVAISESALRSRAVGGIRLLRIKIKITAIFAALALSVFNIFLLVPALLFLLAALQEMLDLASLALQKKINATLKKARRLVASARRAELSGDTATAKKLLAEANREADRATRLYEDNGLLQPELGNRIDSANEAIDDAIGEIKDDRSSGSASARATKRMAATAFADLRFQSGWKRRPPTDDWIVYELANATEGKVFVVTGNGIEERLYPQGATILVSGNVAHLPTVS